VVAVGDYDNDGHLDIFKTNFSQDTHNLFRNTGKAVFTDMIYNSGLVDAAHFNLGWGTGLVDFDNDGWLDIFVANGHVYPGIDKYADLGSKYLERKQLFHNQRNGLFRDITEEVGGGLLIEKSSRGAAFGDFDNDGDIDVLVINMNDRPTLLRNDGGNRRHWITLKLVGTKSNRDAIGARVKLEAGALTQTAEVMSGGSYLSHNDMRLHFGLGEITKVNRITVRWPSGLVEHFDNFDADRFLEVKEGRGVSPLEAPR
jgi:enediyne biosynthesis protein E4